MVTRSLGMVSTLILVRLLTPADFGLIALGTGFSAAIAAFTSAGIEDAVLREITLDHDLFNTGFTLAVSRAMLTGLVIAALAVPASHFFHDDRLAWIIFALSAATMIDGFENIAIIEFRRNFAFHKEFILWIMPRLISVMLTIGFAAMFHTYWALVIGIISQRVMRTGFSYWMHPFRPRFRLTVWRRLIGYSLWNWALSLVQQVRERSESVFVGRLLGTTSVGVFSVAFELAVLPMTELIEPLCRTSFSGFVECRHSNISPVPVYLRIVAIAALLTIPAGVGISLVADPMIKLVFGSSWTSAVSVVQLTSLAYAFGVLTSISWVLFQVYGLMYLTARILVTSVTLRLILLTLLVPRLGLVGAAIAVAVAVVLEQLLFVVMTCRHFKVSPWALLERLWRILAATGAMAGVLAWAGLGWHATAALTAGDLTRELVLAITVGIAVYTLALLGLWLTSGRPAGAEADALALLVRLRDRLFGRRLQSS
jgi:lipopolysaccharide exporter